jgi:hypothetical protein
MYHILQLEGLEAGEYELGTNLETKELQSIRIKVHKGTYW